MSLSFRIQEIAVGSWTDHGPPIAAERTDVSSVRILLLDRKLSFMQSHLWRVCARVSFDVWVRARV